MTSRSTRRRFLWGTLGAGASLAAVVANRGLRHDGGSEAGGLGLPDGRPTTVRSAQAFGTKVSITVVHDDRTTAQRALDAAFAELHLVDQLMSLYRPDSQVSRLNSERTLREPHPYLCRVLAAAEAMSRQTDGAFDITVQPLWPVYQSACREQRDPDAGVLADALRKIDWRQVELSPTGVRLRRPGSAVTLNGIAQGFAADRVLETLRTHGIEHALVDSGEIGVLGGKTEQEDWRVGVQHPRQQDAFVCLTRLRGRCLSTSGDYATYFRADHREHHIFDPRSGRSPSELASVSIAARTATAADALSTAVFVLGLERGLQLVRATPETDAFLVLKDGRTLATEGFPMAG